MSFDETEQRRPLHGYALLQESARRYIDLANRPFERLFWLRYWGRPS